MKSKGKSQDPLLIHPRLAVFGSNIHAYFRIVRDVTQRYRWRAIQFTHNVWLYLKTSLITHQLTPWSLGTCDRYFHIIGFFRNTSILVATLLGSAFTSLSSAADWCCTPLLTTPSPSKQSILRGEYSGFRGRCDDDQLKHQKRGNYLASSRGGSYWRTSGFAPR
jgi:hypothetical protein